MGFSSGVSIPVGVCVPWYNLNSTNAGTDPTPPYGWELCDGGTVATVGSPIFGKTKPPLMRTNANSGATTRMPRGKDTVAGAYGGTNSWGTGGSDTNSHTHGPGSLTGGNASDSGHSHSGSTDGESSHSHGGSSLSVTINNAGVAVSSSAPHSLGSWTHNHGGSISGNTGSGSNHNHGGSSLSGGYHSHSINVNGGATGTPSATENRPAYVDLAWLIRVL